MASSSAPEKRGFSVPELAQAWGTSRQHIYRLVADGEIKAFHVGRRIVIPAHEVDRVESKAVS